MSAGKWFDGGAAPAAQCHRHTFINRHPSQPCGALNTLTARQWAKHHPTAHRKQSCFVLKTTPTHWTNPLLSCNDTHTTELVQV